ncbi:hypothetical protein EYR40_010566 [Pleurotus pulmonarius]|nr:hypothetical protein EYR36_010044 [Pleurotus pulmonarius]KAF4589010.1 hypothetical protein EYR40_010566 [Pleurotus pulmonarius]
MPARKGKAKAKGGKPRGRRTWAKGSKLDLLLSFEEEHRTTADAGGLYKKITAQFLDKYGYDLPFNDEPEDGFVPVIPNLADLPYEEQIAEQARRDDISVRLRVKIANWMRHRFNRKQTDEDMVADLLSTISMLTAERPRKRTAMNIYWAENYATRIKKEFTKYWQTAKLTMPADARMSMCADYVKSRFEDETEEFRFELQQRADAEYKEKMDEYNKRDVLNGTPEAYARAWDEADNFLPIFVDAIAKKFGMAVSLLLAGPLGSEGGRVVMRSAHSNNVGGMTSLMWPEYDNPGFEKVQESMIRYAESVFSPEECKRRVHTEVDENDPSDGPSASDQMDSIEATTLAGSRPAAREDEMNLIEATTSAGSLPASREDEMNLIKAMTPAGSLPAAREPMNMMAGSTYANDSAFDNIGMQPEGEFTSLLRQDWDWDAMGFNPCQTPMAMPRIDTHGAGAFPAMPGFFVNTHGAETFPVMPHAPSAPGGFFAMPASTTTTPSTAATPVTPHAPTTPAALTSQMTAPATPAPGMIPVAPTLTAPSASHAHTPAAFMNAPSAGTTSPAHTPAAFMNAPSAGTTSPAAPTSTAVNTHETGSAIASFAGSTGTFMNAPSAGSTTPAAPTSTAVNTHETGSAVPSFAGSTGTFMNAPSAGTTTPAAPTSTAVNTHGAASPGPSFADGADTNTPAPGMTQATPTSMASISAGTTSVPLAGPESSPEAPEAPEALPLNGKENKLPPRKKRAREEPAHPPARPQRAPKRSPNLEKGAREDPALPPARPQRAPKMPPHLADAGYVQPSKGTRKAKAKAKAPKKK